MPTVELEVLPSLEILSEDQPDYDLDTLHAPLARCENYTCSDTCCSYDTKLTSVQ